MPRITFCAIEPRITHGVYSPFSQGIRQLRAAIEADRVLADWEVRFVESEDKDIDRWVANLLAERADVIGFSCFVWSFATFVAIAERLRAAQPGVRLLFGGPAARTVMFKMPAFTGRQRALDAMVAGEGEWSIVALLQQRAWDLPTLTAIPGVFVPTQDGWMGGLPQLATRPLDDLPSAILAGLCDVNRTATMERFRGCPMSCAFCQWGDQTTPHRVFSEDRIRAELSYLKTHGIRSFNLVDAGLNLNSKAFRNLVNAEADVGLFREVKLYGSIYPSIVNDEHLEFLSRCKAPVMDVGVQSFNPAALAAMDRPFREDRFETVMHNLMQVCLPEPELIFGLPGDNPGAFKDGVLRLLKIGCRVRAFHCLVLPDALMSRSKPEHQLQWDPETLLVTSAAGWTPRDLAETHAWLDQLMADTSGEYSNNTWTFCAPGGGKRMASPQLRPLRVTDDGLTAQLQPTFAGGTSGAWLVRSTGFTDLGVRVNVHAANVDFHVDLIEATQVQRSYRVLDGVAVSYRTRDGAQLAPEDVRTLDRLLPEVVALVAPALPTLLPTAPRTRDPALPQDKVAPTREGLTAAWREHGLLVLERVVPEPVCARLVAELDRQVAAAALQEPTQPWPTGFADRMRASAHAVMPFWDPALPPDRPPVERLQRLGHQLQQIPEVAALLRRPEILGTLGIALAQPLLVSASLVDKVPGGSLHGALHQDSWYLHAEPESLVTLQIALDDADEDNGCELLLATAPDAGIARRATLLADGWREGPTLQAQPDCAATPLPMARGTALLYSGRTWHASPPNRSQRHRRVIVAQFIDATSRWAQDNWLPEPPGGFPRWQ